MLTAISMSVALGIDWLVGWPDPAYRRIGHPVTWIGRLISGLERGLNRPGKPTRLLGALTAVVVIAVSAGTGWAIALFLPDGTLGAALAGVLAWPLVAARSLHDHVDAVATPLEAGALDNARAEVARIVGRDPSTLDTHGVARATIESLAENTSDGVIAPLFWGVVFGLPGIAGYKAVNTLDSMIGHKTERYRDFGWAAAKLDDLANHVPARLTGAFFAMATGHRDAWRVMWHDGGLHRSPNAGWPEAAMAGALGIRLSGPRAYEGVMSDEPWVNQGAADPASEHIGRALSLYRRTLLGTGAVLLGLVLF